MWHTRDLSYFVAIAEHRHFTRAAADLYVSQSALSKQIAALERQIGVKLFDRVRDGVRLTPAGEALLPFAQQILALTAEGSAAARDAAARVAEITIGFWLAPGNGLLGRAICEFGRSFPDTRVLLRRADWGEPVAGVDSREANLAVVWVEHGFVFRGLRQVVLDTEQMSLATSASHPLADRDEVTLDDLEDSVVLTVPPGDGPASEVSRRMGRTARATHIVRTIDETFESIVSGIAVIPVVPSIVKAYLPAPVVALPLRGVPDLDLVLVWRPGDEEQPQTRSLIGSFVKAAGAG